MKQTPVEWLVDQLRMQISPYTKEQIIEEAKEMENQQSGYSKEDLRESFSQSRQCFMFQKDMPPVYESFEEWFAQFKK
jgi:hypothetical protein